MPYGFVRIFIFFKFFLFFWMITFDRQAGPLQNFNRSHVMVIGRSVSFSDPARPPGGGVGRPKHPKIPPPPETSGTFLKKKFSREKKLRHFFKTPGRCFCEKKKFQLLKTQPSSQMHICIQHSYPHY